MVLIRKSILAEIVHFQKYVDKCQLTCHQNESQNMFLCVCDCWLPPPIYLVYVTEMKTQNPLLVEYVCVLLKFLSRNLKAWCWCNTFCLMSVSLGKMKVQCLNLMVLWKGSLVGIRFVFLTLWCWKRRTVLQGVGFISVLMQKLLWPVYGYFCTTLLGFFLTFAFTVFCVRVCIKN